MTSANTLRLGDTTAANTEFLDGRIDEVRVWGRALAPAEIGDLHLSY